MEKEFCYSTIFISLIVFSTFAYAVGSSEGGSGNTGTTQNTAQNNTPKNDTNKTTGNDFQYKEKDCETFETLRERLRCRLIQGEEYVPPKDNIEEACRDLNYKNRGKCTAFYASIRTCYKLEGRAKDSCFKRAAGLVRAKLSEESSDGRAMKARNYLVALLYDLQEKIEKSYENGKIDANVSSALIEKIVQIKKAILNGESREEIRRMMAELREMWRQDI